MLESGSYVQGLKDQYQRSQQPETNAFNQEKSRQRDHELLYGPLADAQDKYPPFAHQQLKEKFLSIREPATAKARQELRAGREAYWHRYQELTHAILDLKAQGQITTVTELIARTKNIQAHLRREEFVPALDQHIDEVAVEARKAFLTPDGQSRLPHLLSATEAELLSVAVAPLHDILKHLGTPDVQLPIDHEVVTKEYLLKVLPGLKVTLGGQERTLTPEEVTFIADTVGDHENLYEEEERHRLLESEKNSDHAKVLFFIPDTLTGLIDVDQLDQGHVKLKESAPGTATRWQDLCTRHLGTKVFRPTWIIYSLRDLHLILHEYEKAGYQVPAATKLALTEQAIAGVHTARALFGEADSAKLNAIEETLETLEKMKTSLT